MKKLFLITTIAVLSTAAFSQTLTVSGDGKSAIQTNPETKDTISKKEMEFMHRNLVVKIARMEKELAELKAKEKECADICAKLKK